LYLHVGSG
jgi:hypothetical protein